MSSRVFLGALASFAVFGFAHPLVAAPKKSDQQRQALVSALKCVSPDALGGKLGHSLTSETPLVGRVAPVAPTTGRLAGGQRGSSADNLAYRSWKAAKNS